MTDTSVFGPLYHALSIDLINAFPRVDDPAKYAVFIKLYLYGLAYVMPCIHCRTSYRPRLLNSPPDRAIQGTLERVQLQSIHSVRTSVVHAYVAQHTSDVAPHGQSGADSLRKIENQVSPLMLWWYHTKEMVNEELSAPNLDATHFLRRLFTWSTFSSPSAPYTLTMLMINDLFHCLDEVAEKPEMLCEYEYRRQVYPAFFWAFGNLLKMSGLLEENYAFCALPQNIMSLSVEYWSHLPCIGVGLTANRSSSGAGLSYGVGLTTNESYVDSKPSLNNAGAKNSRSSIGANLTSKERSASSTNLPCAQVPLFLDDDMYNNHPKEMDLLRTSATLMNSAARVEDSAPKKMSLLRASATPMKKIARRAYLSMRSDFEPTK